MMWTELSAFPVRTLGMAGLTWSVEIVRDFTFGQRETQSFDRFPHDHVAEQPLPISLISTTLAAIQEKLDSRQYLSLRDLRLRRSTKSPARLARCWSTSKLGLLTFQLLIWPQLDRDVRVRPRAAAGSHPPLMNGAATLSTCSGERTISNGLGTAAPPTSLVYAGIALQPGVETDRLKG